MDFFFQFKYDIFFKILRKHNYFKKVIFDFQNMKTKMLVHQKLNRTAPKMCFDIVFSVKLDKPLKIAPSKGFDHVANKPGRKVRLFYISLPRQN